MVAKFALAINVHWAFVECFVRMVFEEMRMAVKYASVIGHLWLRKSNVMK